MDLNELETYLKSYFKDYRVKDSAINGVQVANNGKIDQLVSAVDFSLELLGEIESRNTAILVHHGIFWGKPFPIQGRYYSLVEQLIKKNNCLIAVHLPLDIHPECGNNILLARELGLESCQTFGDYKGTSILMKGVLPKAVPSDAFLTHFQERIAPPLFSYLDAKKHIKKIALCTGGGLFGIDEAVQEGVDTYITGDVNHVAYHQVRELGVNLICGGHYATEVYGVKKLGEHLSEQFNLKHTFVDIPTGL